MMFFMYRVDPEDHIQKVLCQYLYCWLRYRLNIENRPLVIIPTHQKLTEVPRVIHDILDIVGRPHDPKILCQYLYYWLTHKPKKENIPIMIIPTHPKLTEVPRDIHDGCDVLGRP